MIEGFDTRVLVQQIVFALLAALILFVLILPLDPAPGGLAWPDFLLLITLVWIMRRPEYLPVGLVCGTFLAADILLQRPLGLWTALMILWTEFLRGRLIIWRDWPFLLEWGVISAMILGMTLLYRLILAIFLVPQVAFLDQLWQIAFTALAYPIVTLFAVVVLRLRRSMPGENALLGGRA